MLDILRIGAYQLLHLDRVPAAAVVNDAVNLTKKAMRRSAAGTVNAILRRLSRSRNGLPLPSDTAPLDYLSVTCSHPRWLVERWVARYGEIATRAWVNFDNQPAPMTIRANTLVTTADELASRLAGEGVTVQRTSYAPDGLIVTDGQSRVVELVDQGHFVIQDEASQLVGVFAAAQPGELALDACAAPGSKTTQLAAGMENRGLLVASDLRGRRLRVLKDRLETSGAVRVPIVRLDVRKPLPFGPVFDAVLLDAPCSGLGTLRRDPDVKWRVLENQLEGLAANELQMLEQAASVVKPGGRLVYSTCSSEPVENDDVFDSFLARHPEFAAADPRRLGLLTAAGLDPCLDLQGRLKTTPHQHGLEAFFAAMAVRRSGRES